MSTSSTGRHGAPLPYKLLAGIVPCPGGWLVASGRLQGITVYPQEPEFFTQFIDVLDYKPAFSIMALALPVGLLSNPHPGGRACDRAARRLLGPRRGSGILSPPIRTAIEAESYAEADAANGGLSAVTWTLIKRMREVTAEIQPYWQRTVFEVHPELSFYQLNNDVPMQWSKRTFVGQEERRVVLEKKVQGVGRIVEPDKGVVPRAVRRWHLLDAAACLWTARRISARAVARLPEDPEWDDEGLRMELVR